MNKAKQTKILAAIMCASSIVGSYTVTEAGADNSISYTYQGNTETSSVEAKNNSVVITAGAEGSTQSILTIGNKNISISTGGGYSA